MNYLKPELIDRLASEYVVGTLRGPARRRFERLMATHYWVRAAVWQWESQLVPMVATLKPVTPPRRVWNRIRSQVGTPPAAFRSILPWLGWAAAASLAVVVALTQLAGPDPRLEPNLMAVFADEGSAPLWTVSLDMETGQIVARSINASAAAVDKVFQLWMLPQDGSEPRSLGLLPVSGGRVSSDLPPGLLAVLKANAGLAVSIEPIGGSPTGLPTGPVVHQAQWVPVEI